VFQTHVRQEFADALLGQLLDVVGHGHAAQDNTIRRQVDGQVANPPPRAGQDAGFESLTEMWKIFRHKEPQQPPAHTGCLNLRQQLLTICEDGEKKRHKSAGWSSMMQFPDQTGGAPGRGGTGMLWRSILAAAAILGLWVEPAAAGLYNPAEPDEG